MYWLCWGKFFPRFFFFILNSFSTNGFLINSFSVVWPLLWQVHYMALHRSDIHVIYATSFSWRRNIMHGIFFLFSLSWLIHFFFSTVECTEDNQSAIQFTFDLTTESLFQLMWIRWRIDYKSTWIFYYC